MGHGSYARGGLRKKVVFSYPTNPPWFKALVFMLHLHSNISKQIFYECDITDNHFFDRRSSENVICNNLLLISVIYIY